MLWDNNKKVCLEALVVKNVRYCCLWFDKDEHIMDLTKRDSVHIADILEG